jgi:hypothetical protein
MAYRLFCLETPRLLLPAFSILSRLGSPRLLRRDHQNRSQSPRRRGSSVATQAKRGACALFIARELGLPRLGFPNNVDSLCWQSDASSYVPMIRHWDRSADVGLDGATNRYQPTSASAVVWRGFIATRIRADRDGRNQTFTRRGSVYDARPLSAASSLVGECGETGESDSNAGHPQQVDGEPKPESEPERSNSRAELYSVFNPQAAQSKFSPSSLIPQYS